MNDEEFQKLLNADAPLVLESCLTMLTLDDEGFAVRALIENSRYPWRNVSSFIALQTLLFHERIELYTLLFRQGSKTVCFNDETKTGKWERLVRFFNRGYNQGLPCHNGFAGLTSDQLAQLMNHWRERAIGANKA